MGSEPEVDIRDSLQTGDVSKKKNKVEPSLEEALGETMYKEAVRSLKKWSDLRPKTKGPVRWRDQRQMPRHGLK